MGLSNIALGFRGGNQDLPSRAAWT